MSSQLTNADVARLLQEPSPQVRAEVAGKLAQDIDSPRLTEGELAMAYEIVRLMAKDVETSVRQALAQSLRHAVRLPHDVALQLAQDVEAVALPIIEHCTILTDADLIMLVEQGSQQKQSAIAGRPNVSAAVSDVLITCADEQAVTILMKNPSARITEQSLSKAVDRFEHADGVKEAMVKRAILPVTIAERLVALVSDRLQEYLVANHELSDTVAADLVLQSREKTVINMSTVSSSQDIEKLVLQMHQNHRLTPSIVIPRLMYGRCGVFSKQHWRPWPMYRWSMREF